MILALGVKLDNSKKGRMQPEGRVLDTSVPDLWPSSQGERFTTKLWFPGLTEKPIRKIMDS